MNQDNDKLKRARMQIVLLHPFIASTLLKKEVELDQEVSTAQIDRNGRISISPDFLAGLTGEEAVFLLAHECLHAMLGHAFRRQSRDPQLWNAACDAVINETLIAAGIGSFIEGGVRYEGAEEMTAERVYDLFQELSEEPQDNGIGEDLSETGDGEGGDKPATAEQVAAGAAKALAELMEASNTGNICGNLPAALQRQVQAATESRVPWYEVLERYFTAYVRDTHSWCTPSRRSAGAGVYLPGRRGAMPTLGPVVVAVDTSGSVSEADLAAYAGHINAILTHCQPEEVRVIYCDAQITGEEVFYPGEEVTFTNAKGGGGTSFVPVFDHVAEEGYTPDFMIYFTDLYGQFPTREPDYPVLWVVDNNRRAPFGSVITS